MKYLITGVAGFIGFHTCKALLKNRYKVIALDNLNSYYDINLKQERLNELYNYSRKIHLTIIVRCHINKTLFKMISISIKIIIK